MAEQRIHPVKFSEEIGFMVPRIPEAEFSLQKALTDKRPMIITGALARWNIAGRWTPPDLKDLLKNRRAALTTYPDVDLGPWKDPLPPDKLLTREVDFSCAMDSILDPKSPGSPYIMQQPIPDRYPELMDLLEVPIWIRPNCAHAFLWLGRDTITPLHFDFPNNMLAQVYGEKEITLFSPSDTEHLYPHPTTAAMPHLSRVNAENPNLTQYPGFAQAKPVECVLRSGELLLLPAFWWHHVRSRGVSTAVSFTWNPQLTQFVGSPNASRLLLRWYEADRLEEFRRIVLAPNGLGLPDGAQLMLKEDRIWDACLLTLAALDDLARRIFRDPAHPSNGALEKRPDEIRIAAEVIGQSKTLSPAHRNAIAGASRLASSAFDPDGPHIDRIDRRAVEALASAVSALQSCVQSAAADMAGSTSSCRSFS